MFKWLFHILIFATNDGSGKYQNKEKPLKRQRKLGLMVVFGRLQLSVIVMRGSRNFRQGGPGQSDKKS